MKRIETFKFNIKCQKDDKWQQIPVNGNRLEKKICATYYEMYEEIM